MFSLTEEQGGRRPFQKPDPAEILDQLAYCTPPVKESEAVCVVNRETGGFLDVFGMVLAKISHLAPLF